MGAFWNHIVIEGLCFADDPNPCGREISNFCLKHGHCPYLGYTSSNEREAAYFVPLVLIIKDKLAGWWEDITSKVSYYLWYRWHKSWYDNLDNLPTTELPEWDEKMNRKRSEFANWIEEAKKEE